MARLAHLCLGTVEQVGQATVGKTLALEQTEAFGIHVGQSPLVHHQFNIDDLFDLMQEPGINLSDLLHLFQRPALGKRIAHIPNTLRTGLS